MNFEQYSLWLPGRGTVFAPISATFGQVTRVSGASGAGASTLLGSLSGSLPRGAMVHGRVTGLPTRRHVFDAPAAAGSAYASKFDALVADVLADSRADTPVLVLLDQPLAYAEPGQRPSIVEVIGQIRAAGAVVIWAEHDAGLIDAGPVDLGLVDTVLDLSAGTVVEAAQWRPASSRTVPPSPVLAAEGAADRVIPAARLEINHDLEVPVRGVIALVAHPESSYQRALRFGLRLASHLDGDDKPRPALELPLSAKVSRLGRLWTRSRGGSAAQVWQAVSSVGALEPRRQLGQHSTGQRDLLAWALAYVSTRTEVVEDPARSWDSEAVALMLASGFAANPDHLRIFVTRDRSLAFKASAHVIEVDQSSARLIVRGGPQ